MSKLTEAGADLNDPVEPAEMNKPEQKPLVEQLGQFALNQSDDGELETATLAKPRKPARVPRMLRELGGRDDISAASQDNTAELLEGIHGTRSTRQDLRMAMNNTAQQARKSLNEKHLMKKELSRGQSVQPKAKKQVQDRVKKIKDPKSEFEFGSEGDSPSEASQGVSGNDEDFVPNQRIQYLKSSLPKRTTRKASKKLQANEMVTTAGPSEPERLTWDEKKGKCLSYICLCCQK